MSSTNTATDHDFSLCHVADEHKRGFGSMFVVMMGFTFFSASMWAGGTLGAGLSFKEFLLAVLAGNLILGVYTSLLALIASRTGLSVHLLSRYSFGEKGSYIPSAVLALTQIGWFGVGVAMFAIPTAAAVMDIPSLQGTWLLSGSTIGISFDKIAIPARLLCLIVVLSGMLMTSSAYFGITALAIISFIAVPAIAVFGGYSAYQALFTDPVSAGFKNGFDLILQHTPAPGKELTLAAAVTIAIGSFISGGTCTPDFTRFSTSPKVAVSTTALAFFLGNSMMFFFGAAGCMVYGQSDISLVLKLQGLLVPAIVVLGLNIWTTNDNALYTSGLGLSNITKIPKRKLVIVNGLVGTLASIWLYDNFCGWLNFLNTIIPPVGAILITDFFIVNKAVYPKLADKIFEQVNLPAVIAWASGSFVALVGAGKIPAVHSEFLAKGLPAINGMVVAFVVYLALKRLCGCQGKCGCGCGK